MYHLLNNNNLTFCSFICLFILFSLIATGSVSMDISMHHIEMIEIDYEVLVSIIESEKDSK